MKTSGLAGGFCLFHMCVIGNMILAIAEIALASGAVTELQTRASRIRATADRTLVAVGSFTCRRAVILRPIGIRLLMRMLIFISTLVLTIFVANLGEQILHTRAEENKIVQQ